MAKKELKTNVMRVLDSKKLAYNHYTYDNSTVNGVEVARLLGQEPDRVFKTLVTRGKSGGFFVFMVPVAEELDLKKAARAVGVLLLIGCLPTIKGQNTISVGGQEYEKSA